MNIVNNTERQIIIKEKLAEARDGVPLQAVRVVLEPKIFNFIDDAKWDVIKNNWYLKELAELGHITIAAKTVKVTNGGETKKGRNPSAVGLNEPIKTKELEVQQALDA